MEPYAIGIDLGTTFSEAAYVDENGEARIIEFANGEKTLPSVVDITEDGITVGPQAMTRWLIDKERVVRWVKRSMGDMLWRHPRRKLFTFDVSIEVTLGKKEVSEQTQAAVREAFADEGMPLSDTAQMEFRGNRMVIWDGGSGYVIMADQKPPTVYEGMSAIEVSAEILKAVKTAAQAGLGCELKEAVITCPAYFNAVEVDNTWKAGELAGLTVKQIVKEPVAAAVHHGIECLTEGQKLLVCDLGGGTFDATIVTLEDGKFTALATVGNRQLGGHDWTADLVDLAAGKFQKQFGKDPRIDAVAEQALYEACEEAKLSYLQLTKAPIACVCDGKVQQVTITRDEFEARTEWAISNMLARCEESLQKGGFTWADIDQILLVGGSSRLRRVKDSLAHASGKKPTMAQNPDLAVALGAAIISRGEVLAREPSGGLRRQHVGGIRKRRQVTVTERNSSRSLGTRAYDPDSEKIVTIEIIPRGATAPISRSNSDLEVSVDGQECFDIPIVEFEDEDKFDTITNYRFNCLPSAKRGNKIKLTFSYDISGRISAEAVDMVSGTQLGMDTVPYVEPPVGEIGIRVKPFWLVFALDKSSSMKGEKFSLAKQALIKNARESLAKVSEDSRVGIVAFGSEAERVCEPTDDLNVIDQELSVVKASGSTAMDDGIRMAENRALSAPAGTTRIVALLTDGMPNDEQDALDAAQAARDKGITLCCLGIGHDNVDKDYLRQLSLRDDLTNVIEVNEDMGKAMTTLLSLAGVGQEAVSGGLRETTAGGLRKSMKWT